LRFIAALDAALPTILTRTHVLSNCYISNHYISKGGKAEDYSARSNARRGGAGLAGYSINNEAGNLIAA
jgi:hypothetical protein